MVDIKYQHKTISDIIFQFRKEKNLTYTEFEELTGVSRSVLHRIERGETKRLELKNLKAIAAALPGHYTEIMECYLQEEYRTENLFEILNEILMCEVSHSLAPKIALKILQSPNKDTEDALQRLYEFTEKLSDPSLRVALYKIIVKYSREHGVMKYIAKGLLQKHLIERLDLKRLEKSFHDGQEVLHYLNFLSLEEQITLYLRMTLLAFATKKYDECIQLCKTGVLLEQNDTELKARAYLAMINSYLLSGNYDEAEKALEIFELFTYDFVEEAVKITRAVLKARRKEYDKAVPMLQNYIEEIGKENKVHLVIELLDIYLQTENMEAIAEILDKEEELLPDCPQTPQKHFDIGMYYRLKSVYSFKVGLFEEGIEGIVHSLNHFGVINDLKEREKCIRILLYYSAKYSKPIQPYHANLLKKVYN
ncbi:helix-turn-helix domain-containing protein [Paenibacillus ehimensis]|uniref:Helix-turn-helix domain-containing protein n=2 Tax=Paenibacillus ehimensis TaxID=79264 RepID=A0ABT8VD55_9BACL|nr:helix-turn-helix domain-containing protein [Paenibacillus ehimensis]MDO3678900.1 helix-turn-helix domain-containing protein [Paenibacillus ehimensis]